MNSDDELEAKMKEIEEKIANNQYDLKDNESEPSVKIEDVKPKDENDLFFATEIDPEYQKEAPAPAKNNKSVLTKTIDESMNL